MIVLDTHAWIWWVNSPDLLSQNALHAIDAAQQEDAIYVSCISTWEIYMLVNKGRLQFTIPAESWISRCEKSNVFQFVPTNNEIMRLSVNHLGKMHEDPADRMIAATTIYLGATLITKDHKLRKSKSVPTLW